jgi:hypothetical protein
MKVVADEIIRVLVPGGCLVTRSESEYSGLAFRAYGAWRIYRKPDGRTTEQIDLDGFPVFDGLIVAGCRLYIAMQDGRILCLEGGRSEG